MNLSNALRRFARGETVDSKSIAISAYDPSLPRSCTALVNAMRAEVGPETQKTAARMGIRTIYSGAAQDRLTGDFIYALRSPDQELKQDLRLLRSRARQLERDDPHAQKFLKELVKNVIGPKGIRLRARHKTTDSTADKPIPHDRANKAIEAGWCDYKRRENAFASRDMTFDQGAGMLLRRVATDGEAFVHRIRGFDNAHGYALDLIDPDQFDETYMRYAFTDAGPNEIRMGIEIDEWGAPVTYWPWKRHPSEYGSQVRIPIPAKDILHIFVRQRPRQTRGVTWFHPILRDKKMFGGYQESELVAARTAAAKMGFFKTDASKGGAYSTASEPDAANDLNAHGIELDGSPGSATALPVGVEFQAWDPQHPTAQYEAFTRTILMSIAAGLDVSYASLTGDLSRANYSSMREGKTSEHDAYEMIQQFMTDQFYRPVYEDWLPMAIVFGALKLPTAEAARWRDVQFLARGWAWVDPFKDAQANSLLLAMGLTSHSKLAAEVGTDFRENIDELAEDKEYAASKGVILSLDTRLTMTPGAGGSDDTGAKPDEDDPAAAAGGGAGESAFPLPVAVRARLNGSHHVTIEHAR